MKRFLAFLIGIYAITMAYIKDPSGKRRRQIYAKFNMEAPSYFDALKEVYQYWKLGLRS